LLQIRNIWLSPISEAKALQLYLPPNYIPLVTLEFQYFELVAQGKRHRVFYRRSWLYYE